MDGPAEDDEHIKRDLAELREQGRIEFGKSPHPGHHRIAQPLAVA